MALARFYVEIPDISKVIKDSTGSYQENFDIDKVALYESQSREGTYGEIDVIDVNQKTTFVETVRALDMGDWFKFRYVTSTGTYSDYSDPMLCEDAAGLIDLVREEMHDTAHDPVFKDTEYIRKLRGAAYRHNGTVNLSAVKEYEWEFVSMLMKASVARDLSKENSRFHSLSLPGGLKLEKGEISDHYRKLSSEYERAYTTARKQINEVNSISNIKVGKITKVDLYTGRVVNTLAPTYSRFNRDFDESF